MSKKLLTLLAVLAACVFVAKSANAIMTLSLDDGLGDAVSLTGSDGVLIYNGPVGAFDVNVTTGVAYSLSGDPSINVLDLTSVNMSSGEGELTIMLTNTDYIGSASMSSYLTDLDGYAGGNVMFQSYLDTTNTPFGMGTLLNDTGILSSSVFSSTNSVSVMTSDFYSLTTIAKIWHASENDITGFVYEIKGPVSVSVPEPTSLTLFGIGLIGLAFTKRRKKT